jgi:hypothetical protein
MEHRATAPEPCQASIPEMAACGRRGHLGCPAACNKGLTGRTTGHGSVRSGRDRLGTRGREGAHGPPISAEGSRSSRKGDGLGGPPPTPARSLERFERQLYLSAQAGTGVELSLKRAVRDLMFREDRPESERGSPKPGPPSRHAVPWCRFLRGRLLLIKTKGSEARMRAGL